MKIGVLMRRAQQNFSNNRPKENKKKTLMSSWQEYRIEHQFRRGKKRIRDVKSID